MVIPKLPLKNLPKFTIRYEEEILVCKDKAYPICI